MLLKLCLVHNQRRLYKNLVLLNQSLTLPNVSFCRPYIAYMGTDNATLMITAPGKISNHIFFLSRKFLLFFLNENTA